MLIHFKKNLTVQTENQIRYEFIKVVNFTVIFLKDFWKIIKLKQTFNEGKFFVAERFIRNLKNKMFKHMAAISKNAYFDV